VRHTRHLEEWVEILVHRSPGETLVIGELETSRLLVEQQQREIELLREQVSQLKEMIELMRK
jgi:hypothetical protein